jgi:hypothetical protein
MHNAMNSPHASFDFRFIYETISLVPFTEGVSGDEPESERDAASCGLARNHVPREAAGDTALPPLRAERANALREAREHRPAVQRLRASPRRVGCQ